MVNSHYVPQFILRGFCKDNNLIYCNIENKKVEIRNPRSVFSEIGYYPDTIEKDLCKKSEHSFANLFHNKIENAGNTLKLTPDELFEIKKYLIVSSIRYRYEMTDEETKFADMMGDSFKPAFIENLNYILNCNSPNEMMNYIENVSGQYAERLFNTSDKETAEVNYVLWAEIKDILQSYLIFVRPQGNEKFIISDRGKSIFEGPMSRRKMFGLLEVAVNQRNINLMQIAQMLTPHDYTFFPLTENLAVVSMSVFFKLFTDSEFHYNVILPDDCKTVSSMIGFGDKNVIVPPKVKISKETKEYHYKIQRINDRDVAHFNSLIMAEAVNCFAFSDIKNLEITLNTYTKYTDRDFSFLRN